MKIDPNSEIAGSNGFTLVDLLVVIGVVALLIVIQLPAWAAGKSQSKIAVCADHIRQLGLASQIYANDNNTHLPNTTSLSVLWAWDTPPAVTTALLNSGSQTNTFYCPGTSPRFTDQDDWLASGSSSLWNFEAPNFHVIGYVLAFEGNRTLISTNRNSTILPETIGTGSTLMPPPLATERVLIADATLSLNANPPGYLHPENNYTTVSGGFYKAHTSPHLNGNIPSGGNLGFKDGHVEWRQFELMVPRTTSGVFFWW
jgi:type II secretory pathway pseudopilin PulG